MFSSVIPASAATVDKSVVQGKGNTDETQKQKIKKMKQQVKFKNKETMEGNRYTEASLNVDGIDVAIILDDEQELTDEMLTRSVQRVEEEKMAADLRVLSESLQTIPNAETTSTKIPAESDFSVTPYVVAPPETDGHLLGNSYRSFSNLDAYAANLIFKAALGGIFANVGLKVGDKTGGAVAIGALAAVSGDYQPFKASWTQARVWESWSSTYACYLEDLSITYYTSSSYSTVKKVFFKYDIKRVGQTF